MKAKPGFVIRKYNYGIGYRIVDPTDAVYPQVNGIASPSEKEVYMWEVMQEEFTKESLTKAVMDKFGDDEKTAEAAAGKFIDTLTKHHLLDGVAPRFPGMPG